MDETIIALPCYARLRYALQDLRICYLAANLQIIFVTANSFRYKIYTRLDSL